MTLDLSGSHHPGSQIQGRAGLLVRFAGFTLGLAVGMAGVTLLSAGSAAAAAPVAAVPRASTSAAATPVLFAAAKGDDGRRSFGVQPAGPKKLDPRPNFTYQNVKPGQRLLDHVGFVNISDKPVTLAVYPADGYNTNNGAFDLLPKKKKSVDIGSWVKMTRTNVTVPAQRSLILPIEIKVPKNAEPGDHAGGIVASLTTLAKDSKGNTVTVDQRVGSRLYIRVAGPLTPKIELDQNHATYLGGSNPFGRGDAEVGYTIRNTGNVRLVGTKVIRVSDVFGSSKQAIKVPEMDELLPGGSVTVTTRVQKVLPALMLTAHVTIDPRSVTGNVDPALEQANASIRFWALYWPARVLVLLGVGEGLRRWWLWRRRRSSGEAEAANGPAPTPTQPPARAGALTPRVRVAHTLSAGLVTTATAGLMLLGGGTAQAAGGGLTFIPGKGMDISPMYTVTSAPCPKTATNVVGRIFGKGFDSKGLVVIQNSDAAIRHDVAFGVPLQDTIAGFAQTAGVKLKGKYKIEVQCVNELATKVFATFTGTINFSDATHFTGPTPKIPPAEGVPTGFLAQVFPEFKAGNPPKAQASGGAKPSASGPAAPVDGSAAAASAAAAASGTALKPAGDSSLKPFAIIIVGIALLGAVGFIATRPRPATAGAVTGPRAAGGPAPVEWPDESETASPSSIFFAEPEAAPTGVLPQPAEAALVVGETTAEESVATESPATEAATETVAGESVSTPSVTAASPVVAGVKPSESAVAGVNPVATEPAKIAAAEMESTAPATAPAPTIPDAQTPSPEQASSEQGSPERAATQQPTPEQSTPPETPTNPRSPAPRSLRGRPVPRVIADQPVSTGPGRTP